MTTDSSGSWRFDALHALIGGSCPIAPDFRFTGLNRLETAKPGELSFLSSSRYRDQARLTLASAVLVRPDDCRMLGQGTRAWLVDDPYLSYARVSSLWRTPRKPWWVEAFTGTAREQRDAEPEGSVAVGTAAGRDMLQGEGTVLGKGVALGDGAILGKGVVLGDGAILGKGVVLGDGAILGKGVVLGAGVVAGSGVVLDDRVIVAPGCFLGSRLRVGEESLLGPGVRINEEVELGSMVDLRAGVVIEHGCAIGNRVRIHANSVIGADGFGFAPTPESTWVKIEQLGRVVIGDDVEIGALCSIDRGALGDTRIGRGSKLDNQIQIGHNVCIGEHCAIAGCVGIAGSTELGDRVRVGGGAGILGHLRIADDVVIAAMSLISESISAPGFYGSSYPQMRNADWERSAAIVRQLPQLRRRLMRLEALARVRPDGPAGQSRPEPDGEGGASD